MLSVLTGGVAQMVCEAKPQAGLKRELEPMTKLEAIYHHEENSGRNSFFAATFPPHTPMGFMCGVTVFCEVMLSVLGGMAGTAPVGRL